MSKRVEQYKADLQRAAGELVELLEIVKKTRPDKGFEKRDSGAFTELGLRKEKVKRLKEAETQGLPISTIDAGFLCAHNQAMVDIDTKIDKLKEQLMDLQVCLGKEGDSFKEKVTECFDAIMTACGYSSDASENERENSEHMLFDEMCSVNVKKHDLMSPWEQLNLALTLAIRGFLRFFDEVQSLVTRKVMNDTRETRGAREVREFFNLESRSQFFPKPLLSIDDAVAEWLIVRENLSNLLKNNEEDASLQPKQG